MYLTDFWLYKSLSITAGIYRPCKALKASIDAKIERKALLTEHTGCKHNEKMLLDEQQQGLNDKSDISEIEMSAL